MKILVYSENQHKCVLAIHTLMVVIVTSWVIPFADKLNYEELIFVMPYCTKDSVKADRSARNKRREYTTLLKWRNITTILTIIL